MVLYKYKYLQSIRPLYNITCLHTALAAAMVPLTLHLLTGTVARVSQVIGLVLIVTEPTPVEVAQMVHLMLAAGVAVKVIITACVLLVQAVLKGVPKDFPHIVTASAVKIAPAIVRVTAAVPLRIPAVLSGVCRPCKS